MAEIGIIDKFRARHGSNSHEHEFKVEIVLDGNIDSETSHVQGVDHHDVISNLKSVITEIEDKNLKEVLSGLGYKSSGNESIASYFVGKMKGKYPIKYVQIWETEDRYARVYGNEVKIAK